MIHYELFFFYMAGYRPKDVVKSFGYSRGTAYRFHRIYQLARQRARNIIEGKFSVSPEKEKKVNDLDV